MPCRIAVCLMCVLAALASIGAAQEPHKSSARPTLAETVAAKNDLWGELAMQQPNGASYEFFEPLLPPPRYVHADFRHYPLVLSSPNAHTKARLISNGSGVNLRGGSRSWKEAGTAVVFRVGPDEFRFGDLRERLSDPTLAERWLPIYEITYRHPSPVGSQSLVPIDQKPTQPEGEIYRLEAFVSTDTALAESAVVFVRFSLAAGAQGVITVQLDSPPAAQFASGEIQGANDQTIVLFDRTWKWERQAAHAQLIPGTSATLAIATKPLAPHALLFHETTYAKHRDLTARDWTKLISGAAQVQVSEQRINSAWRNLLVQNLMLASGDRMLYSAGNQYEALYEAEGSDAALAMLAWGLEDDARRMFVPLLDFTRPGLENHQAGLKLNDVICYWWLTRDREWVREMRPRIEREVTRLLTSRDLATGLLPKERYCGDIATPVHSLSVESKAWRAL